MKRLLRAFTLLCLLVPCAGKTAKAQTVDYSVHANIIYRFTKYIKWPPDLKSGNFIIGIIGDSPLYDELKIITSGKSVGTQKIEIQKFSHAQQSYDCCILFINEDESNSLKKIIISEPNSAILIITEENGLCLKGSGINFIIERQKLKLEINTKNIEKRSLKIATELLDLATIITQN